MTYLIWNHSWYHISSNTRKKKQKKTLMRFCQFHKSVNCRVLSIATEQISTWSYRVQEPDSRHWSPLEAGAGAGVGHAAGD